MRKKSERGSPRDQRGGCGEFPLYSTTVRRLLLVSLPFLFLPASAEDLRVVHFPQPVDAVSVVFAGNDDDLSVYTGKKWEKLAIEDEQDPLTRESNLVMLQKPVTKIVFRGTSVHFTVHPISISHAPLSYELAATTQMGTPHILSRRDWGADERFGIVSAQTSSASGDQKHEITAGDNGGGQTPQRVKDCDEAQRLYPDEFKSTNPVRKDLNGNVLRWPERYSPSVKLLVVHHTADTVTGDDRPAVERMRALYAYHANNRGWGDLGYNFMIDETGQIYEGRAGGDYVVGGHAYCYNVGTVGVALMGNFDEEVPPQAQVKSLQWLLRNLANRYDIDLSRNVTFHGKTFPSIVRHRDLLSTECPGYYLTGAFDEIRNHVIAGTVENDVTFPAITKKTFVDKSSDRLQERLKTVSPLDTRRLERIGRKVRTASRLDSTSGRQALFQAGKIGAADKRQPTVKPGRPSQGLQSPQTQQPTTQQLNNSITQNIRVHLTYDKNIATVSSRDGLAINGASAPLVQLGMNGTACVAIGNDQTLQQGVVRIEPQGNDFVIDTKAAPYNRYKGALECRVIDGKLTLINELSLDEYIAGLSEEPDSEPAEKQKAFAVAARTYAAYYLMPEHRKFPGLPYDGDDSPARFQAYAGVAFTEKNPQWASAAATTAGKVLTVNGQILKTPYFSSDDGRTRTPVEAGWGDFPFAAVFSSKPDPWCKGMALNGHGVGMSGCGAKGQAKDGKKFSQILEYYYPGTVLTPLQ